MSNMVKNCISQRDFKAKVYDCKDGCDFYDPNTDACRKGNKKNAGHCSVGIKTIHMNKESK
jgi:hypothetical protein